MGKYRTLVELAQAMGISNDLIYRVRKGERGINGRFIIGATEAFPGYKLDDLFYVSEDWLVKSSNNLREGAPEIKAGSHIPVPPSSHPGDGAMTVIWVSTPL